MVTRKKDGTLQFKDFDEFQPNLTPKEVLQMGSFGGTYFRPIKSRITGKSYVNEAWEELPNSWLHGLNIETEVASSYYDININKYKVKCGASLEMWEDKGLIKAQDPYGWFQWYCRFYRGRRTDDDKRQIDRWLKLAGPNGRFRKRLLNMIKKKGVKKNDYTVSPVIRQVLLHWAYQI